MEVSLAGVDRSLIASWLGHESLETTQTYLDANLAMKEEPWRKRDRWRVTRKIPTRRSTTKLLKDTIGAFLGMIVHGMAIEGQSNVDFVQIVLGDHHCLRFFFLVGPVRI
jgi:hypothetical protein